MEALIVLISEFLLVLVIAGIVFLIAGLLTLISGSVHLGVKAKKKKVSWLRRLSITFTVLFIITLALALVINFFLFEPTARLVLGQVKTRTGIDVTFDSAKGNIFAGTVQMTGVKLKREKHQSSLFDLHAEDLSLDMDMTALITFKAVMEELKVTGLKGTFRRVGKVTRMKSRKSFIIENFILEDIDLQFSDTTRGEKPVTASVKVPKMQSAPFRSQLSIFDFLFNSTCNGTLEETSSFAIEKKESPEDRKSQWTLNDLPLELIGEYVGGPLKLISEGSVFIEVQNQRHTGEKPGIKMDWHLVIRDIKARVPEEYPDTGIKRRMADRVVSYINDHPGEFSFRFSLDIKEETFKDLVSFEGTGFQEALRKQLTAKLVDLAGKAKEKIKEIGKKGIKKFKDFLDKRQKRKE
ncbi:MAG: hypothetical protein JSV88_25895 [Candidatus Aminicenantes bacterium]|nr:MAG: hypothetical protein JSV88_25895 [Candidatus Aminicenantes bacterium]